MNTLAPANLMVCLLVPLVAHGHHAVVGSFDTNDTIEIDGEVTDVSWRNPHVYITLESTDGEIWELESNGVNILQRAGISRNSIAIGDVIQAAGYPPRSATRQMFLTNVRLPSGAELIFQRNTPPRWSVSEAVGDYSYRSQADGDPSRPELGLFRVWSHTDESPRPFYRPPFLYPLTDTAMAAARQFSPANDNPTGDCTWGMPTIMMQPHPIEFSEQDGEIHFRIEQNDTVRTIDMTRDSPPEGQAFSPYGYSTGRWDGETLVVTTTRINWPWFNNLGVQQSQESELLERFTPTNDGSRLDYELTVTDPATFTESLTLTRYWVFLPEAEVLPFDCSG